MRPSGLWPQQPHVPMRCRRAAARWAPRAPVPTMTLSIGCTPPGVLCALCTLPSTLPCLWAAATRCCACAQDLVFVRMTASAASHTNKTPVARAWCANVVKLTSVAARPPALLNPRPRRLASTHTLAGLLSYIPGPCAPAAMEQVPHRDVQKGGQLRPGLLLLRAPQLPAAHP